MKKHKKTRQEKRLADLHRKIQLQQQTMHEKMQYSFSSSEKEPAAPKAAVINSYAPSMISSNPMILSDIVRTFSLTAIILIIEFLLFLAFKNHIIVLPNISF